jgi:hypothetical protein
VKTGAFFQSDCMTLRTVNRKMILHPPLLARRETRFRYIAICSIPYPGFSQILQ